MAHWGGSGPKQKTCRQCTHWQFDGYRGYDDMLKPAPCAKFLAMMNVAAGPRVPPQARACKYFEEKSAPPSLRRDEGTTPAT
jgi:hypothetical protein